MYLAFVAYFGHYSTLLPEASAVAVFAVLGLLGLRFPALLVLGYALHGGWDLAHEIWVHLGGGAGGARPLTDMPLAYGVFCAAYDWCMAVFLHQTFGVATVTAHLGRNCHSQTWEGAATA
jgi:hypothetical protein